LAIGLSGIIDSDSPDEKPTRVRNPDTRDDLADEFLRA
jgi:hypothetical protein